MDSGQFTLQDAAAAFQRDAAASCYEPPITQPPHSRKRHSADETETEAKKLSLSPVGKSDEASVATYSNFTCTNNVVKCEPPEQVADNNFVDAPTCSSQLLQQEDKVVCKPSDPAACAASTSGIRSITTFQGVGISQEEINEIIEGLGSDIDELLDAKAEKNKLTVKNVKSILRHVMTNEYVLAMVRNTMRSENVEGEEFEEAVFEPKLTRSKAKELREKQAMLPWPVSSPSKENSQLKSKKLLDEVFSEEESSSDEEYKPNEEECRSGDEDGASAKRSEKSAYFDVGTQFSPLVIADSETEGNKRQAEADLIALRTRSKLPLTDTPLETIEASFVAPDITIDMYSTECDDEEWQKFLCELSRPLDSKFVEQPDEDDPVNDPEYNVLQEEEVPEEEDFDTNEDSVKVSRMEMKDLMTEILEAAEIELTEMEDEDEICFNDAKCVYYPPKLPSGEENANMTSSEQPVCFTLEEMLQLEEQMRMHVQLLCQSFLLSHGTAELCSMAESTEGYLKDLRTYSFTAISFGGKSAFHAHNLDEALSIVQSVKLQQVVPNEKEYSMHTSRTIGIQHETKKTIARSKVFMYPELLPHIGLRHFFKKGKAAFTRAEDNLVVLGLDQFAEIDNPIQWIQNLLVIAKTELQIKVRIKNCKAAFVSDQNPIKYYYKHKKLPPFPRIVKFFDPMHVKAPCDMPYDILPQWMMSYMSKPYTIALPLQPRPVLVNTYSQTPKIAVVQPMLQKPFEKKKYSPILPRVSPMKRISPILKKYVQRRRVIPIAPFCTMPIGLVKKCHRPIKPKLKSPAKSVISVLSPSNHSLSSSKNQYNLVAHKSVNMVAPVSRGVLAVTQCVPSIVSSQMSSLLPSINSSVCSIHPDSRTVMSARAPTEVPVSRQVVKDVLIKTSISCNIASGYQSRKADNEVAQEIDLGDDVDDEAVDDEQDLAALMLASSTICKKQRSAIKKKTKHQRDLESTLALLSPYLMESDPKKEERENIFALSYLLRVVETLKSTPDECERFLKLLCSYEYCTKSPLQLFTEVQEILKDHPALVDDFVGFLRPEQAMNCGKFMQYTVLCKIRLFLRKLEVHFSQQPHHIQRILRTLSQLQQQTDITSSVVIEAITPLLRNQTHLLEEFMQLLPDQPPPESLMTDFEEVKIPNSDGENSSCDSVEEVTIPETHDPYGCKDCPCSCHSSSLDVRMQNRSRHCVKCGTKFLDGRIYIQTGKVLKPAQVIYRTLNIDNSLPSQSTTKKLYQEVDCRFTSPPTVSTTDHKSKSTDDQPQESTTTSQSESVSENSEKPIIDAVGARSSSPVDQNEDMIDSGSPSNVLRAVTKDLCSETCNSSFPCDVIEDAVLPPDSGSLNNVPADFSHLKEVISQRKTEHKAKDASIFLTSTPNSGTQKIGFLSDSSISMPLLSDNINATKSGTSVIKKESSEKVPQNNPSVCSSTGPFSPSITSESWTREQDKIVLETCQKHGINEEAFEIAAKAIVTKTTYQIETRITELIQLFKQRLQNTEG